MKSNVLVIGHADADGHLMTEQVRRNLTLIDTFNVTAVVDPSRTRDHRFWTKLDAISEIEPADLVFFVDMMFGPATFAPEAKALVEFVINRPDKHFFLIDHHPLPLRRPEPAPNLRAIYRPDVFECALGPRSGLMVVAALCEHQQSEVADIKAPIHETLAIGMRRAAALGGPLPGEKLLALLKADRWDSLLMLGREGRELHFLPRGRRPLTQAQSNALRSADQAAKDLLQRGSFGYVSDSDTGRTEMSYDADIGQERYPTESDRGIRFRNVGPRANDLEAIITLLEVAALSLTTEPDATFSLDRLIREARAIGGEEIELNERDIKIVMQKATFVEKVGKEYRLR